MEVPSGSIYKHLFEAQSQLADSLDKSRAKKASRDAIKQEAKKERTSLKPKKSENFSDEEDYRDNEVDVVRGLEDISVSKQNTEISDNSITTRLSEKRLAKHSKALTRLDEKLLGVKNSVESVLKLTLQKINNE